MPIEIKELIIRAEIYDPKNPPQAGGADSDGLVKDEIIQACVKQVMQILRASKER